MANQRYPVRRARFVGEILLCWAIIGTAILAAKNLGWWFYPLACLVIGNRQVALLLLTHEAVHFTLVGNRKWNDRVGRWFCAFPLLVSLQKYRRLHLLHHGSVGDPERDPDFPLYGRFPRSPAAFFAVLAGGALSLRLFAAFLAYLTELPEAIARKRNLAGRLVVRARGSDFFAFCAFQAALWGALAATGHVGDYCLYFLAPMVLVMQPHVIIGNAFQHGPLRAGAENSRTMTGAKWWMEILFPCDINFHAEHHLDPSVPHYWLSAFSRDLEQAGQGLQWQESVPAAALALFPLPRSQREKECVE